VVPLHVFGDRYHVGVLSSAAEAEAVRRAIVERE
jgi:hypothetical protein